MKNYKISELEFICIMALLMALAALSIDAILPGLNVIGKTIGITDPRDNQLLITMIFFGLGFGQLITGTLSDSLGRKPVVYMGYIVFAIASFVCVYSTSIEMMIFGRLLQGIGLSAPRSVGMSIIRDKYKGDRMARIMSFITVVFILAPVVAPTLGKILLDYFGWEAIFHSQLIIGLIAVIWLWQRQEETLKPEYRKTVRLSLFTDGIKEFVKYRQSIVYTIIIGITFGPFLAYISASQQIFEIQYDLAEIYPYIFSGLAIGIGVSTFMNGTLVIKYGMSRISTTAIIALFIISATYVLLFNNGINPSSYILIIFLGLILFTVGFVMGNITSIAMEPIGHIAGIGAAIIGFVSTVITVTLATFIGRYIETSSMAIFIGFAASSALSLLLVFYLKRSAKIKS